MNSLDPANKYKERDGLLMCCKVEGDGSLQFRVPNFH